MLILSQRRPLKDVTARNYLIRFESGLAKKFAAQLESFNEDDFRRLEQLKELFEFLDQVESASEEEVPIDTSKRSSNKTSAR